MERHYQHFNNNKVKLENESSVEMLDIYNESNNNSDSAGEGDPLNQYVIEYLDNANQKGDLQYSNNDESLEDKGYRTFLVADYVDYCKNTDVSKCLIRNCERPMSGRRTGNIKRHYHKVHKFVIVHSTKPAEKANEARGHGEQTCITVNLDKYFDYDPLSNKSRCKMPGCNAALMGRKPNNIMRHYSLVHNFKIGCQDSLNEGHELVEKALESKETLPHTSSITEDELVIYDVASNTNQCLFITCQELMVKDLGWLEKHYNEVHKVVIASSDTDNIPNRFYRKRIYRYIHQAFENEKEYVESKIKEYMQEQKDDIKNEPVSEDEQPHCSNQLLKVPYGKKCFGKFNLSAYVDYEKDSKTSKCLIKHCKRTMRGSLVGNIKRHYLTMHNFVILHGTRIPFEEIEEMSDVTAQQITELLSYDKNSLYQCLFTNCACILEENLSTIKRHYLEVHKIIIVRYTEYMVQRKRKYRPNEMTENYETIFPDVDESCSMSNEFLSDEEESPYSKHLQELGPEQTEQEAVAEKRIKYGKLWVDKYVDYQKDKNVSKCLIKHCKRSMSGCFVGNIKRHYLTMHKFVILHGTRLPYQVADEMLHECSNTRPDDEMSIDDLVPYDIATASYQCLFINCNQILEKHFATVKKHYHDVHRVVIARDADKTKTKKGSGESLYSEIYKPHDTDGLQGDEASLNSVANEFLSDEEQSQISHSRLLNQLGKKGWGKFIFSDYVRYDNDRNGSNCLIKHCKRSMSGCIVGNIKRHYRRMHNFIILHGVVLPYEEIADNCDNGTVDNIVSYNVATSSYQCIFTNCNQVLQKYLPTLKFHYRKEHRVIIATDSDNIRKRKYREIHESQGSEFLDEESCSVRNEFLSDDEQSNCSKRSTGNYMSEMVSSCFVKKEHISDEEKQQEEETPLYRQQTITHNIKKEPISKSNEIQSHKTNLKEAHENTESLTVSIPDLNKNSISINITWTRQSFLHLCLGLVIENDLSLNVFDDSKYFKPLLRPYEQAFDCNIDAKVMQDIMLKANSIIIDDLTRTFSNRIVCLELNVLKGEMDTSYYVVVNIRFLAEQTICNKLIGYLPINETSKTLPIAECLSKFNISEQQVYMKTIMAGLQDDEGIYRICDNLCKHNADFNNHPIYDLQTILRSFVHKYSQDVKSWQKQTEYDVNINNNLMTNLKEFAQYLENWSKVDLKLQQAKCFFKACQIYFNFMEKLSGEQYVAGDFYRDLLCCELGLKGEQTKNNNTYAAELYEGLSSCKNKLLESNEFLAALYLDARFNFLGSLLLTDSQKTKGKLFLCGICEKFDYYLKSTKSTQEDLTTNCVENEIFHDDEYALLTQHINDTMPVKSHEYMQHKLTNCVPTKRQSISMDILKYWRFNCQSMEDINELMQIVFTHSASQYILIYLQTNVTFAHKDTDKFDKFLIKSNQNILETNLGRIFEDFN